MPTRIILNKLCIQPILYSLSLLVATTVYSSQKSNRISTLAKGLSEETQLMVGAPIIFAAQSLQTSTELAIFSSSPKMRELGIRIAQNRRALIKQNLKQKEKNAINGLYVDFNIPKEQQQKIALYTRQYIQFEKQWLSTDHENFNHHEDFPKEIMPILQKNNIKPSALQLSIAPKNRGNTIATASMLHSTISHNRDGLKVEKVLTPPTIKIYPFFHQLMWMGPLSFLLRDNDKKANLIHETGHIKAHHHAKANFLWKYLGIDGEKLQLNKNYEQLRIIHEEQTEIFSAIKDSDDASILRLNRFFFPYPETLGLAHYAQLAVIDDSHHLERHLKANPIPIQKVALVGPMQSKAPAQEECFEQDVNEPSTFSLEEALQMIANDAYDTIKGLKLNYFS